MRSLINPQSVATAEHELQLFAAEKERERLAVQAADNARATEAQAVKDAQVAMRASQQAAAATLAEARRQADSLVAAAQLDARVAHDAAASAAATSQQDSQKVLAAAQQEAAVRTSLTRSPVPPLPRVARLLLRHAHGHFA